MDEQLFDNEILEEGTELVMDSVVNQKTDLKKYGLIGGALVVGAAAVYGGFKFGKKKYNEFKAKKEESKVAMSNIQPEKESEE